jgi:diadenosine tetraphosphate (Ap4A) HIT family hydrolase
LFGLLVLCQTNLKVVPKYHCEKLHELPPEEMVDIGPLLVKVAAAIGASDYNLLQNNGEIAHQAVKHVHFHLIPKPSSTQGLGISWPSKETNHPHFAALAATISGKL